MPWTRIQASPPATAASALTATSTFTTANLTAGTKLIAVVEVSRVGGAAATCSGVDAGAGYGFNRVVYARSNNGSTTTNELSVWALDTPTALVGTKPTVTARFPTVGGGGQTVHAQEVSGLVAGPVTDGAAKTLSGYAAAIANPTYTSTATNEYLLYAYGDMGSNVTLTTPAGYSALDGQNLSAIGQAVTAYKNTTAAAETGTFGAQGTNSAREVIMAAFPLTGYVPAVSDIPKTATGIRQTNIPGTTMWLDPTPTTGYTPLNFDPISV